MLLSLLICFCAAASILADFQCPFGYNLKGDGRCYRPLFLGEYAEVGNIMSATIRDCTFDNATLPMIRSDQENTMFNNIVESFIDLKENPIVILGAVCNKGTERLEWLDGSKINYRKNSIDLTMDCAPGDLHLVTRPFFNDWRTYPSNFPSFLSSFCVMDPVEEQTTARPPPPSSRPTATINPITSAPLKPTPTPNIMGEVCGNYDEIPNSVDPFEPCFKIYNEPMSWNDAAAKCKSESGYLAAINSDAENKFFWRAAIANGVNDDLHIGALQTSDNANDWHWVDKSRNISEYEHFSPAFPVAGGGNCLAMLTESSAAKWINEDCETSKLPFVCRRTELGAPETCPEIEPKEGEIIFPPGFPTPTIPCEYTLVVPANNLVKLEILAFDVHDGVDFLDIYEGTVGKNLIASITGTIQAPFSYTTKSANAMRVNWRHNPLKPSNDRGFKMRYSSIPTGK